MDSHDSWLAQVLERYGIHEPTRRRKEIEGDLVIARGRVETLEKELADCDFFNRVEDLTAKAWHQGYYEAEKKQREGKK